MKTTARYLMIFYLLYTLISCQNGSNSTSGYDSSYLKLTVAVVLPLGNQKQKQRFERIASWYMESLNWSVQDFKTPFCLSLEWYDEDTINCEDTAQKLAERNDIIAIIGPLKSFHLEAFARACSVTRKPLIPPCATSESIIRAFAVNAADKTKRKPFLWSLTESDITQTDAILSKIASCGPKSIALLSSADIYGKTFFDWVPFMASDLKLTLKHSVRYTSENTGEDYEAGTDSEPLKDAVSTVFSSGADYIICALASSRDAEAVLTERAKRGDSAPQIIFTASCFTERLLSFKNEVTSEGVEGASMYAAPSTGFTICHQARYGEMPTASDAQLYDAFLLTGFAAAICISNDEKLSNENMNDALMKLTYSSEDAGDISGFDWNEVGISMMLDDISNGDIRLCSGASGQLVFDSETWTTVTSSTYIYWTVIGGEFVILDYTASASSKHVTSNRSSWTWNTLIDDTKELDQSTSASISYPVLENKWAVLIAASKEWNNYRHQADVLHMYQILKNNKYPDDHIILILEDDIASSQFNNKPGEIRTRLDGENLYPPLNVREVAFDYKLSDLTVRDIQKIMLGEKSETTPVVLETDEHSNILWFWSGHGTNINGNTENGKFSWSGKDSKNGFTTELMKETLQKMHKNKRYRKMLILAETCYASSVVHVAESIDGVLVFAAANGTETSLADVYSIKLGVWLSNRFTRNFIDYVTETPSAKYTDLYTYLAKHTMGSHVRIHNAKHFDNLALSGPDEFLIYY